MWWRKGTVRGRLRQMIVSTCLFIPILAASMLPQAIESAGVQAKVAATPSVVPGPISLNTVTILGSDNPPGFSPFLLLVHVGDAIQFTNGSNTSYSIAADANVFTSPVLY